MNEFNIGDEVYVVDRAWSWMINTQGSKMGTIRRMDPSSGLGKLSRFRILGLNCSIPIKGLWWRANALILNIVTGDVWAVNACNLEAIPTITVRFTSNGVDITDGMSERSKREVLKANNY
jgi:hypothetical protein